MQPMMFNLQEEEQYLYTISFQNLSQGAIFPKFIKDLNAQQNMKHKRDIRRNQHNISNVIKQLLSSQVQEISLGEQLGQQITNGSMDITDRGNCSISLNQKIPQLTINGNRIICNMQNNFLHGQTQIYYSNGNVFKGIYQHGIRINGTFHFNNGYQYNGGFFANKFKGYGQLKIPTGKVFCGNWHQYNIQGNAEIRYLSGEIYYGNISNFQKHGQGYLFLNDGRKYIGQFHQGHMTGNGQLYQNQKILAKGQWKNGQLIVQDTSQNSNRTNGLKISPEQQRSILKINSTIKNDKKNIKNIKKNYRTDCKKTKLNILNK